MQRAEELESVHTEVLLGVAPAFALLVQLTLGAVLEWVVPVSCKTVVSNVDMKEQTRVTNQYR